nr:hypothetical protein CFP56_09327 [Quercus suber]
MVQVAEQTVVRKRGPGRPPKNAPPVVKKPRLSTTTSVREATPAPSPPAQKPVINLPTSALEHRPLPTLPEAQSLTLSDSDYQSLAQSAVVRISLDRSRKRWTQDGIFARYWVKPATGKNAKPPPEGNPEFKWMKEKGECRIRVEPHIFEVLLYVEEKPVPKPIPPPKQYVLPGNTASPNQPRTLTAANTTSGQITGTGS